ncbi:MAG: YrdB family protein [Specibacter sp.]
MGRRAAEVAKTGAAGPTMAASAMVLAGIGFALEVAMVAAFFYWGFRQAYPLNLVVGIGVPAVVVVLWGIFMAPRSERRLSENAVNWASLGIFLLAGVALLSAGTPVLGVVMLVVSAMWFAAGKLLPARP